MNVGHVDVQSIVVNLDVHSGVESTASSETFTTQADGKTAMTLLQRNASHLTAMNYATCNAKWVDTIGGPTSLGISMLLSDVGGN